VTVEAVADETYVLARLAELVRTQRESLTGDDYAALVRGADLAFTSARYELAQEAYDLLASQGHGGEGVLLRQVHVRILRGVPEEALDLLAKLPGDVAWSLNGDRLRAVALMDLDRAREAVPVLRAVIARAPDDATFVRLLVQALKSSEEIAARLEELDEIVAHLPGDERFELLFRVRLAAGDLAGLERLWVEDPPEVPSPAADQLAPLIRELDADGQRDLADRLLAAIGPRGAASPRLATAALGHFLVEGDWESADAWLKTARSSPGFDTEPHLKLKELQYHCFTLQLENAAEIAAGWRSVEEMPEGAATVVGALHGALGRWDDVIGLLHECVELSVDVESETLLEAVGLAARRTGRYRQVADLLRRSGDGEPGEGATSLRDRLGVEVSLLGSLGLLDSEREEWVIGRPFLAERADRYDRILRRGGARAERLVDPPATQASRSGPGAEGAIVFCTDRRYLVGTCVAVSSLVRRGGLARSGLRLLVVSSADAVDLASEALASLGAGSGAHIEILPAPEVIESGLRTGWGCFTPGHGLSEAAYYRLFAVRKLLDEGVTGRVLYVDSDTCFGDGVEEFFALDLRDAPLAARFELDLPSIAQAARKLGLDRETYFNSGVLLFDMQHPGLVDALDRSIAIATEQPELLTFLDQCALNLAFHGSVEPLPERLNYYVRPKDELAGSEPAVWHFLTHWKPWDPQYSSENCRIWDGELEAFAALVPDHLIRRLLALQFESRAAYSP
jgi:lipopolysaccharide biosynthesis glycosyltransferase